MHSSPLLVAFEVLLVLSICLALGQDDESRALRGRRRRGHRKGRFKPSKIFSYLDVCPDAFVDLSTSCSTTACGLRGNATGIIVCRDHPYYDNYTLSTCIDPTRGLDDDACGVCEGDVEPIPCQCACNLTDTDTVDDMMVESGVEIMRTSDFYMTTGCVSPEDSVTFQLAGRYECVSC